MKPSVLCDIRDKGDPMPRIHANGIEIAYGTVGDSKERPLILIMGLATQMLGWPDRFCRMLAGNGHWVIRFDNRDCGLSSKLEQLRVPDLSRMAGDIAEGRSVTPPYTLSDMASDTVGVMDALGIRKAHICGLSMGGMIGQIMALEHPSRMMSLISMESTTGESDLPGATAEADEAMMSLPPVPRNAYLDYTVDVYRAFAGGSEKMDGDVQRRISARCYDRMFYPMGFARQMAAIYVAPGRREALRSVTVPTLVIHGDSDALIPPEHGRDTADAIPGARLVVVKGLGHGMAYPTLWEEMANAIVGHTLNATEDLSSSS